MRDVTSKTTLLGLAALAMLAATAAKAAPPPTPTPTPAAAPAPTPASAPPPAPAATPANPDGPLVAGVCLFSQEGLIARSKVGQAATARLRELAGQAQASLNAEKARLEARGRALEAKRATLSPLQYQAQGAAINQSIQALQAKAGDRSVQIDATKSRAYAQVLQQAQPLVTAAYKTHGCGLLLARETVLSGNMGNDLTPEIVAAFDAKGTPLTFDLEPPRPVK